MKIFCLIFFLVISNYAIAQNNIVIDDRTSILNTKIENLLQKKFLEKNLYFTNSVDYRDKCNYYFSTFTKIDKGYQFKIEDCDNKLLGSDYVGSNLTDASDEEKAIIIFYSLLEIIENPTQSESKNDFSKPGEQLHTDSITAEHDSRYFFAPSAIPLKKRELYYNSLYFLSHDIQYGITDNFTFGMGTTIIGLPVYFTAKYSIPIQENSHLAFGDMMMLGTYGTNFFANLAFGTYTYGNSYNNISIGGGYLYFNPGYNGEATSAPVGNISGILSAGKYFYFLTENYWFSFKATETSFKRTNLPDGSIMFEQAEYPVRRNIWYGLTGIRFVRKNNELVSWQIGLTHMLFVNSKAPDPYNSPDWSSNNFNDGNRLIAFPTISYTRKFKL
ncbi:MAG: hypothetical protein ACQETL_03895 [Bacteroidota bacterium]